jgi:hypothetical protein
VKGQSNGLDARIDKERDLSFRGDDVSVRVSWPEPEPLLGSSFGSSMSVIIGFKK